MSVGFLISASGEIAVLWLPLADAAATDLL
jgi:hypothetical protein